MQISARKSSTCRESLSSVLDEPRKVRLPALGKIQISGLGGGCIFKVFNRPHLFLVSLFLGLLILTSAGVFHVTSPRHLRL